jgi:hypothetical protein
VLAVAGLDWRPRPARRPAGLCSLSLVRTGGRDRIGEAAAGWIWRRGVLFFWMLFFLKSVVLDTGVTSGGGDD